MEVKRKKGKHKSKIRSSTRLVIFVFFGIVLILSTTILYSNLFIENSQENEVQFYKSTSTFSQKSTVVLKNNPYMEDETLKDNELYVTDLIDNLNLNLDYTYLGETPNKINGTYSIKATLKANFSLNGGEKQIWNKEYVVLEDKSVSTSENSLNIKENIDLDLSYYNSLIDDFEEQYNMSISAVLAVTFRTDITAYVDGKMQLDNYENTVNISLGEKVTQIDGIFNDSKENVINKTVNTIKPTKKSVSVISFCGIIVSAYVIIKTKLTTKSYNKISNLFKTELNQIFNTYGDKIVKINSKIRLTEGHIIELNDFNEIIKLAEELYKPILYYQVPNHKEAWFCLILEHEIYRYILK